MLDWRSSQIPFEQLPVDWKAWATAMIESAKVPANEHAHIRLEDSVLLLCGVARSQRQASNPLHADPGHIRASVSRAAS
jgi:hypothetical protein